MPRPTLFAYMIFIKTSEINESYKLRQVRGKHTVGGIVFNKHLFLVALVYQLRLCIGYENEQVKMNESEGDWLHLRI